jgi:hypothetical protein
MSTRTYRFISLGVMIGLWLIASPALAETLSQANVANLTTVNLLTVPAGQIFLATSMVVANGNAANTISCCARLLRSNTPVTGFVTVRGGDTVQIEFDPPITFDANEIVQVRNGASSGVLHFTVIGNRDVK